MTDVAVTSVASNATSVNLLRNTDIRTLNRPSGSIAKSTDGVTLDLLAVRCQRYAQVVLRVAGKGGGGVEAMPRETQARLVSLWQRPQPHTTLF